MEKQYTNTTKTNVLNENQYSKHPADKGSKKDVYSKNYTTKKPCQVRNAGRTLAD